MYFLTNYRLSTIFIETSFKIYEIFLKTQKLNIQKIADLAGVSKATVSRVLNDYPHIRPEMRDKVMDVIRETGYERNNIARMLASNRSNMVGLIIPSGAHFVFSDPYFPKLTEGISKAANKYGLTLALFLFHSIDEGIHTIKNIIANGLFDGIIITGDRKNDYILPIVAETDMKFVLVGRPENEENVNFVDVDNYMGGRIATEHLLERGYQRIAAIGCSFNIAAEDRLRGYRDVLEERGIVYESSWIADGDFSMESGARAMTQLLAIKPDAVFVVSDTMALGALRTLREHKIVVPDEIAVMGFDDLPPAVQADPQLTTIRQPIEEQGELAIETLLAIVEDAERPLTQMELPVELIVRASTQ